MHITPSLALLCLVALVVIAGGLSMLLTRWLIRLLPQWGMVDRPDFKRHIHRVPVPRGGGLGMIVAFAAVTLLFFGLVLKESEGVFREALRFLAPLLVLVPVGIWDDKAGMMARTKLLFQFLAAGLAWWLGFRLEGFFGIHLPIWLCFALTLVWIVGFINAFNMIDGVDGLASGVGAISAICMTVVAVSTKHYGFAAALAVFIGADLGFLRYNWNPARVFMGDTGSMFIGYVLAVSGLMLNARLASAASIAIPILACGIPVLDILFAVWRRILGNPDASKTFPQPPDEEGEQEHPGVLGRLMGIASRLGTADQRHLHHRLLIYFNRNQRKTVTSIYLLALVMGVAAVACCFFPQNRVNFTLVLLLCVFAFIINRLAFIELWQTTELAYHNFQSAHAGVVITYILNPLSDLAFIVAAYIFAAQHSRFDTGDLLRYVAILMAVLITSRSYRVFWNFAVSDDYFRLIRTLIYGFILARASDLFMHSHHVTRLHSYAACVAIALIMLERLGIHYLRNWQVSSFGASSLNPAPKTRTLLIGVTPLTRFYRNHLLSDIELAGTEHLVGIVSGTHGFQHSYCFGLKVLGKLEDLESIINEKRIGKVVLTEELPPAELETLRQVCRRLAIPLARFQCSETGISG